MLEKLFGVNYRTTLTKIGVACMTVLVILSLVPEKMESLAGILPEEWKEPILSVCALAAFILRIMNGVSAMDAANKQTPQPPNETN